MFVKPQFRIFLVAFAFILVASALPAQSEVDLIRQIWGQEKKELINQYLELSDQEAEAFWPLYESFMEEKAELVNARVAQIQDYGNNLTTMTSDKAKQITTAVLANDIKYLKLQQKYYKKMSKAITPLRASEYLQVERYLDTAIRSEVQEAIPFIGEIKQLQN